MRLHSLRFPLAALLCSAASVAAAKNCSSEGSLSYLGRTSDSSRSVWLSTIQPGSSTSFTLEAAQGGNVVDTFGPRTPGTDFRHLSLSPFVSNGNGGAHKLYDTNSGDCLLDTQNQKDGFVFPPFPSRPPVGVRPPIGILPPPGGLMPSLPGGVRPPIATLPPSGVMPTLPGGVRPPIGTLPPTGVMPGVPAKPVPPIATLPPSGVMPERPIGVVPPIGTLPPGGGGSGGTGGGGAITEGRSIAPTTASYGGSEAGGANSSCTTDPENYPGLPFCDQNSANGAYVAGAPLTPGRDLGPPTRWNTWVDTRFIQTDDDRSHFERSGKSVSVGGGIDYALSDGSIVGLQVIWERSEADALGDAFDQSSTGVSVGPYAAISLNDRWALSGSLTWGRHDTDVDLVGLQSSYDQDRLTADVTLTGQYVYDDGNYLRPQFSLSYLRLEDQDHTLKGKVSGTPVSIDVNGAASTYGTFSPSVELGRVILDDGKLWVPYGEFGAIYEFDRPERAGLFGGDEPSRWSGTLRTGLRMRTDGAFYADVSLGYLSVFQSDLDVVEVGAFLAWGF